MAITEPYELDNVSVGATELSIVSGTTTLQTVTDDGLFYLFLDPVGAGVAKGDEFKARIYEKVEATGGTKRVIFSATISDAQSEIWTFPGMMLMHGWDMTLQKVAGTDRNWDASIRAVAGGAWLSEPYELDGVTVGATELSIVSGTTTLQDITTAGFYQLFLDPVTNLAKADEFEVTIYESVELTGGSKRVLYRFRVSDAQYENLVTPILLLKNGWDMTIKKIAGTDRAWDASIRKAA